MFEITPRSINQKTNPFLPCRVKCREVDMMNPKGGEMMNTKDEHGERPAFIGSHLC